MLAKILCLPGSPDFAIEFYGSFPHYWGYNGLIDSLLRVEALRRSGKSSKVSVRVGCQSESLEFCSISLLGFTPCLGEGWARIFNALSAESALFCRCRRGISLPFCRWLSPSFCTSSSLVAALLPGWPQEAAHESGLAFSSTGVPIALQEARTVFAK